MLQTRSEIRRLSLEVKAVEAAPDSGAAAAPTDADLEPLLRQDPQAARRRAEVAHFQTAVQELERLVVPGSQPRNLVSARAELEANRKALAEYLVQVRPALVAQLATRAG